MESLQSFAGSLSWADGLVLAGAVALLFVIAFWAGRKEHDTGDFFLGGRQVPMIVASLSFVATEISAMTIVGVPAAAYKGDWRYLQMTVGYSAAKIVVAFLFLPAFFRYGCTSIYEFLRHRFGPASQYAGSVFFFITRLLASGVRLYVACLGIAVILDWPLEAAIAVFTVVSMAFIAFGGIKAVVWNGAYQAIMFYLAAIAVAAWLGWHLWGQLGQGLQAAAGAGKFTAFDFRGNLTDPLTFWGSASNAFLIGLAIFGADQELVQRLLTVRTRRSSQRAILSTIAAVFPLIALYLLVGTLLFVYYRLHGQASVLPADQSDKILSHFTLHVLPAGLKGLVLATIILASIDSPLASLSASFVSDIYRPLLRPHASEAHYLAVSRAGVVVFALILALIAWASKSVTEALWFGLEIMSVTGSAILGVFLLGLLTRVRANRANIVAMIVGSLTVLALMLLSKEGIFIKDRKVIDIGWTWLMAVGTGETFLLAWAGSYVLDRRMKEHSPSATEN
ncbi:MAG: Sodium/glucose cotransporter [Planctomycetes bacterium ADurb.Bin126]|nr:MAG: Sodium/glucose cotransporter [Planctomycetes bacterium ADurb.Bin126]HOD81171.1 hypothetical protein [Phycisphaerae bacterium]HQL72433.1 hypothetical protein [Phycisphaerae bacterium]